MYKFSVNIFYEWTIYVPPINEKITGCVIKQIILRKEIFEEKFISYLFY